MDGWTREGVLLHFGKHPNPLHATRTLHIPLPLRSGTTLSLCTTKRQQQNRARSVAPPQPRRRPGPAVLPHMYHFRGFWCGAGGGRVAVCKVQSPSLLSAQPNGLAGACVKRADAGEAVNGIDGLALRGRIDLCRRTFPAQKRAVHGCKVVLPTAGEMACARRRPRARLPCMWLPLQRRQWAPRSRTLGRHTSPCHA